MLYFFVKEQDIRGNKNEQQPPALSESWGIPIDDAGTMRRNAYQATAVVRIKKDMLCLYDIINIKKKRVRRFSPKTVR